MYSQIIRGVNQHSLGEIGSFKLHRIADLGASNPERPSLTHCEGLGGICRHPLRQIVLATDLILGILSASCSLLPPHLLAPPKHTNCASIAGTKTSRSCASVKEMLGMPGRVSDVPSRCLISVTAKTHRWRQNQLAVFNCERTLSAELWGQRFGCCVQAFHVSGKKASSAMC